MRTNPLNLKLSGDLHEPLSGVKTERTAPSVTPHFARALSSGMGAALLEDAPS